MNMTEINHSRLVAAISKFDALNTLDPHFEQVDGGFVPKELLYAQRMSAMLGRYVPASSEVLQLAARCQHIQRWMIERSSYPMTKAGYYQWRNALKVFHAQTAQTVLRDLGYDEAVVARVGVLVAKAHASEDVEAQILEDVVVFVFLESYLEQFVADHADYDAAKFADILNKTLRKVSQQGRREIFSLISLPPALSDLVRSVLDQRATATTSA